MTEGPSADLRPASHIDRLCIDTIRTLAMDAVQKANSGHPGTPMGLAPLAYLLWAKHLKHDPGDPSWPNRDHFVMSAGHASMLHYALLYLTGYDLTLDDIKNFRQWDSKTPGHPERGRTPGVEITTGPLGQGISNAIGITIAEHMLAERFNRPNYDLIDHYTYVIASDGDMMEGVSSEACSLAGHLRVGKLIVFYDANRITIEGSTDLAFSESVGDRFRAYGWHVLHVSDGNDLDQIDKAIAEARNVRGAPTLVVMRTHIAYGSPNKQDSAEAHGAPLGEEEVRLTKKNLGWPYDEPFTVPPEALAVFRRCVEKGKAAHDSWRALLDRYAAAYPDEARELRRVLVERRLPEGWQDLLPSFPEGEKLATRSASGKVLNAIAAKIPELVGGSGDLAPSTDTILKGYDDVLDGKFAGRNFHFGVREHAMAAILNGMAAHGGFRVYGATFLIFSDYMRPAIRLAAMQELSTIFIYTHDSIGLGEDGPTHQPIEQLASLRAVPNLLLIRPADANETVAAWRLALERRDGPTALILTRQKLPVLRRGGHTARLGAVEKGAYVMEDGSDVVLIGTGSEVSLCLDARKILQAQSISARVVSMPSWKLFREQSPAYRDEVLPPGLPRLAVEAAASLGWCEWADDVVAIDHFGASAPGEVLFQKFGFTPENVAERARKLVRP